MKRLIYFFSLLLFSSICSAQNIPGNSIHFSGNGNLELNLGVNEGPEGTVEFWVKKDTEDGKTVFSYGKRNAPPLSGQRGGVGIGDNYTYKLYNELISTGKEIENEGFWVVGYTTTNREELIDNNWHHVAVVYSG